MRRFKDPLVRNVFAGYSPAVRAPLLELRELIFDTAARTSGVGLLVETLKWGQPSYVTSVSGSGSTVRLGPISSVPGAYALFVHCQTTLLETFRQRHGALFRYAGNRALVFQPGDRLPRAQLIDCIVTALTYHRVKANPRARIGTLIR